MLLDLRPKKENLQDAITFLNTPAIDFYSGKLQFTDPSYMDSFKSYLLMAINDIESCIRGTFNCDLALKGVELEDLQKMFPVGCRAMGTFKARRIGDILCGLRNLNAHTVLSNSDLEVLERRLSNVGKVTRFTPRIKYVLPPDYTVTVAGVVVAIMLFCRENSIEKLCKASKIFALISRGSFIDKDDGKTFVSKVSHVNLELPIRKVEGNDIISSIAGEYQDQLTASFGYYNLQFGAPHCPSFKISFDVRPDSVVIRKGSLTKTYYEEDYLLNIPYPSLFIKLSNMFPPFVLIDLLYTLKITTFNKHVFEKINENYDSLYSKLNYPKFYIDKNLEILLLPKTIADFRIVSAAMTSSLSTLMLRLESRLVKEYNYSIETDKYSKTVDVFKLANFNNELLFKIVVLRNFALHNYILGEYAFYNDNAYQYTYAFVIDVLMGMEKHFQQTNTEIYKFFANEVSEIFVNRLVLTRYSSIINQTRSMFSGRASIKDDDQQTTNKYLFAESSFIDINQLNTLYLDREPPMITRRFDVEGLNRPLYIYVNDYNLSLLRDYLDEHGEYKIPEDLGVGVFATVKVRKL